MTIPRGRRAYDRIQAEEEEGEAPLPNTTPLTDEDSVESEDEKDHVSLVIMDPAQRKFQVSVNPEWTVERLKQEGSKIHKVPASSQRLVYRGHMLQDADTLKDVGLTLPETILHLFPKPRVVVAESSHCSSIHDDDADHDGAHVPRIVLDPDEAERRSSILVLGSAEIMEAQNNVKLLSFLLLIITSMELLALFTIMLGVPEATAPEDMNDDDNNNNENHMPEHQEIRTWRNSDYFDLAISMLGFYVATLGIKATTENTMRLARRYLAGTFVVGIAWVIFYYYLNVEAEKEADAKDQHQDDVPESDFYVQAAFSMLLPALVWLLCCVRAWQFHGLLREAEEEAEERIRNEVTDVEQGLDGEQELTLQTETSPIT